jgi:hypothetical protein
MSVGLTQASINSHVLTMLGSPVVSVELTIPQIENITTNVLSKYGDHRPIVKYGQLPVLESVQQYTLTTFGRGILNIFREDPLRMTVELSEFDIFRYNQFQSLRTQPADYYEQRLWRDEVKRAVGADEDWDFDPQTGILSISPMPTQSYSLVYAYLIDPILTEVPGADDDLIRNLVLARCKQVLGRIRNKFSGIPGVENAISLDGATLLEEGKTEEKDILTELADSGSRIPPIRG